MDSLGSGQDPDSERVADHLTSDIVFAAPDWSLEEAAVAMVRGGFRHLVVTTGGEVSGLLSMRDIVRCWTDDGAICEVPASAPFGAAA
jgi:CBS domain-containing protein